MQTYKGKFIGPKRIKELSLSIDRTLLDQDVYTVSYRDGTKENLPKQVIKEVATDKAKDLTKLRELRVAPVVGKLMGIITEADLRIDDTNYAIQKLDASVEEAIKKTIIKLWGKEFPERTMMQMNKILKQ